MPLYFFQVKNISRGNGSRATRAAAYRSGERIRDERTGESYDHSARRDVADKRIVLPSGVADSTQMEWAKDRSALWNAAEHAGLRRNSRVAREIFVALPPELSASQRSSLVGRFAQELADKYHNAVDYAVHLPKAGSDERHHHAHLLMTTREVTPGGLGARTTLELSGTERHARGLGPSKNDLLQMRARWAEVTNDALHHAGIDARVDHRSYAAQGIDREPQPRIPMKIWYAEKRSGQSTPLGDELRRLYRERLEARSRSAAELTNVIERQRKLGHARALADEQRRSQPHSQGPEQRPAQQRVASTEPKAAPERLVLSETPVAQMTPQMVSALRWKAYREQLGPQTTAQDSANRWKAYREQQLAETAPQALAEGPKPYRENAKDDGPLTRSKDHDHDFSL